MYTWCTIRGRFSRGIDPTTEMAKWREERGRRWGEPLASNLPRNKFRTAWRRDVLILRHVSYWCYYISYVYHTMLVYTLEKGTKGRQAGRQAGKVKKQDLDSRCTERPVMEEEICYELGHVRS